VTNYELRDIFSLLQSVNNDSGTNSASYPMGTEDPFPGVKLPDRETYHSPFTLMARSTEADVTVIYFTFQILTILLKADIMSAKWDENATTRTSQWKKIPKILYKKDPSSCNTRSPQSSIPSTSTLNF
jgi:hypothetical protein